MTTFTIDAENNITAFSTPDHAEAVVGAGAQPFTSQQQLAELAAAWPAERLLAIWNSFAGVAGFGADLKPVQKFTDRKTAIKRISTGRQTGPVWLSKRNYQVRVPPECRLLLIGRG